MMDIAIIVSTLVFAFLCGSIPAGYLIVKKTKGIDIRKHGSGNIGSTNVKRIAGRRAGIATQISDILKGVIPVTVALILGRVYSLPIGDDVFMSTTGLAAILGHDFTPFLKFNGGKGVNTSLGAFIIIAAFPTLIAAGIYFIIRASTRIVSLSSITAAVVLPIVTLGFGMSPAIIICSAIAGLLLILRHKSNIARLLKGEEAKS